MAAEIGYPALVHEERRPGFNEAAANGRGNDPDALGQPRRAPASMRPRRMAAEMPTCTRTSRSPARFNEAAANGRGNLNALRRSRRASGGFNEAAANGRGNSGVSSKWATWSWLQ